MLGRQRQGALVEDLADTREQELSGRIGDDGPISIEWEDDGMDRLRGAPEALAMLRPLNSPHRRSPSTPPSARSPKAESSSAAGVDDAEEGADRVREHDEVCVLR